MLASFFVSCVFAVRDVICLKFPVFFLEGDSIENSMCMCMYSLAVFEQDVSSACIFVALDKYSENTACQNGGHALEENPQSINVAAYSFAVIR